MEELDASGEPPDPPKRCAIDVLDPLGLLLGSDRDWLLLRAGEAMAELGVGGELRVGIVDDQEMAIRHERDKGVRGTTDVLSYDLSGHSEKTRVLDADVLVCMDEATRQARSRGHGARQELLLYILHAAMHCLGHDDKTPEDAARMHEGEDRVLDAIGVGATYSVGGSPSDGGAP